MDMFRDREVSPTLPNNLPAGLAEYGVDRTVHGGNAFAAYFTMMQSVHATTATQQQGETLPTSSLGIQPPLTGRAALKRHERRNDGFSMPTLLEAHEEVACALDEMTIDDLDKSFEM